MVEESGRPVTPYLRLYLPTQSLIQKLVIDWRDSYFLLQSFLL